MRKENSVVVYVLTALKTDTNCSGQCWWNGETPLPAACVRECGFVSGLGQALARSLRSLLNNEYEHTAVLLTQQLFERF